MALKERLNQGWIHCNIILEVIGRPKDYIDQVIKEVAEAIGKRDGVEAINKTFHEPKDMKTFFSTFVEMELAVRDILTLSTIIFDFMPSNVEILAPSELKMKMNDVNLFLNFLTSKLHAYDSHAKKLRLENMIIKNKLRELGQLPKEVQEADELESLKSEKGKKEEKKK